MLCVVLGGTSSNTIHKGELRGSHVHMRGRDSKTEAFVDIVRN